MPDSRQISGYRQWIYDQYLPMKVNPGGETFIVKAVMQNGRRRYS
jgi:hypothetical protein